MGVWIETKTELSITYLHRSHPAWVCGLKPFRTIYSTSTTQSHPAWVCGLKLAERTNTSLWNGSHPAWVCGLKHLSPPYHPAFHLSHPAWVCGLKPVNKFQASSQLSHTLRGCVDWNNLSAGQIEFYNVTPCVGVWIETIMPVNPWRLNCHTLRGCVDWNSACLQVLFSGRVTPCVGVWIETPVPDFPNFCLCHTLRGCVDWNRNVIEFTDINYSHTLRGCVDWNFIIGFMNVRHFGSHPAWVCGLKHILNTLQMYKKVTPCVGVWIETMTRWIRV